MTRRMNPDTRARREHCLRMGANVAKNAWWMAVCPKHGETQHLGYLGGACVVCQREKVG
jgi:hypothetical protein